MIIPPPSLRTQFDYNPGAYNTPPQINVGKEEHVIPSIEGCLSEHAGRFYSAQNAFRVHEWLRGTSTDPLVLEAVVPNKDGVLLIKTLGIPDVPAYAEHWFPGRLLTLEQKRIAATDFDHVLRSNLEFYQQNESHRMREELEKSVHAINQNVAPIWAFNASSIFFQEAIPKRFVFETMETLDALFTCIITQRDRILYRTEEVWKEEIPSNLFNWMELDKVLSRIHQGTSEGFFVNPETQSQFDDLRDVAFFRQCAMAISAACDIQIPYDYTMPSPDIVYFWAVQILTTVKRQAPEYDLSKITNNVVSFNFQKR